MNIRSGLNGVEVLDLSETIGGLKRLVDGTLACPVCHSPLVLTEEGLLCKTDDCNRLYLIQDGIPIALIEEAVTPEEENTGSFTTKLETE